MKEEEAVGVMVQGFRGLSFAPQRIKDSAVKTSNGLGDVDDNQLLSLDKNSGAVRGKASEAGKVRESMQW